MISSIGKTRNAVPDNEKILQDLPISEKVHGCASVHESVNPFIFCRRVSRTKSALNLSDPCPLQRGGGQNFQIAPMKKI
jgi:hypothetical protein